MNRTYEVSFEIRRVGEDSDPSAGVVERVELVFERVELAGFHSWEEATIFCCELQQKYAPRVTGEADLLDQIDRPEEWTAGD